MQYPFTFSAASRREVMLPVTGYRNGAAIDPTSDTVRAAFLTVPPEEASPE